MKKLLQTGHLRMNTSFLIVAVNESEQEHGGVEQDRKRVERRRRINREESVKRNGDASGSE